MRSLFTDLGQLCLYSRRQFKVGRFHLVEGDLVGVANIHVVAIVSGHFGGEEDTVKGLVVFEDVVGCAIAAAPGGIKFVADQ